MGRYIEAFVNLAIALALVHGFAWAADANPDDLAGWFAIGMLASLPLTK